MTPIRILLLAALLTATLAACNRGGPGDPYGDHDQARLNYQMHRQSVENECAMEWSNCSLNCNSIHEPRHRSECVTRCNAERDHCQRMR